MRCFLNGEFRSLDMTKIYFMNYLGIPENLGIKFNKKYNFCIEEVKYMEQLANFQ